MTLLAFMFIPDLLVDYVLPASITTRHVFVHLINPARLLGASVWLFVVHVFAVRAVQQLSLPKSILITSIAYVPYMGITMTYMRCLRWLVPSKRASALGHRHPPIPSAAGACTGMSWPLARELLR